MRKVCCVVKLYVVCGGFDVGIAISNDDIFLEGRLLGGGLIGLAVPTAQSYRRTQVTLGVHVPCWP